MYVTNPEHPYLKHNGGTHTYILKDYTGYGLGTFFLDQIEKRIHLLGIKRVSCNVHSNNTKNLKRLQNQGFIIESVAKNRYFIDVYLKESSKVSETKDIERIHSAVDKLQVASEQIYSNKSLDQRIAIAKVNYVKDNGKDGTELNRRINLLTQNINGSLFLPSRQYE